MLGPQIAVGQIKGHGWLQLYAHRIEYMTSDHRVAGSSPAGCSDLLPTTYSRYGGNSSQRFMQSLCSFLVLLDSQRQPARPRTRVSTAYTRAVKPNALGLDWTRF